MAPVTACAEARAEMKVARLASSSPRRTNETKQAERIMIQFAGSAPGVEDGPTETSGLDWGVLGRRAEESSLMLEVYGLTPDVTV